MTLLCFLLCWSKRLINCEKASPQKATIWLAWQSGDFGSKFAQRLSFNSPAVSWKGELARNHFLKTTLKSVSWNGELARNHFLKTTLKSVRFKRLKGSIKFWRDRVCDNVYRHKERWSTSVQPHWKITPAPCPFENNVQASNVVLSPLLALRQPNKTGALVELPQF